MIYFQSILSLYQFTSEEKQEIVVQQLVAYADINKQHESFFQYLSDFMENTNSIEPDVAKSILNISIDFLNSLSQQFTLSNIKQYVQYLLRLFSLKTQPSSYSKFTDFIKRSFRLINQYNQESLYSSLSKIPLEQSLIPLSILYIQNEHFFSRILKIFIKSFADFQKEHNLIIWTTAMTNFLINSESKNQNDEKNSDNISIISLLNKVFPDKFFSTTPKFDLLEAALRYLPQKSGDDLLSSHCLSLITSVSISSNINDITNAINFGKTVLIRLKSSPIPNLTTNQLVDSIFTSILPNFHSSTISNGSLTDFFNEVDKEYLQSKITADISSENVSLSTLFLISRYPTPETIPYLLSPARVDPKIQYEMVFHFLSHNLVPYRFLPRLFSILEPLDLHFLNEIFEKKPVLYCTAAIKFLSQCRNVEKIEFIADLFKSAKTLPLIESPYAQTAFIVVVCLRSQSKGVGCPIRLLIDYLNSCMRLSASKEEQRKVQTKQDDEEIIEEEEEQSDDDNKSNEVSENGQVRTSDISNQSSLNQISPLNGQITNILDLTNEDIATITNASKESSSVHNYDVNKSWQKLSEPSFCQSRAVQSMITSSEQRESIVNEAKEMMKEGNAIYSIIIGSISNDPVLIHSCIQMLSMSDHFLLMFFFTTSAICNQEIIMKELKDFINKEPDQAPQSFVSRLFSSSSKSSTTSRRQRLVRRCLIGIAPFVTFSNELYEILLASFPADLEPFKPSTEIDDISNNSSKYSSLVCECVNEVCKRITKKEDLHLILQKLIQYCASFEPVLLVRTLINVLTVNKSISDKDSLSLTRLWIKLLLTHKGTFETTNDKGEQSFESVFLTSKSSINNFLKEIENAIRINGDVPSLFASFKRSLPFLGDSFNLTKQQQFLTLIISNTLSEHDSVLEFCVSLLRSSFEVNRTLNPLKGVVFSNEYIQSVRPFFTELSSKFQSKQLIQLTEALLSYYQEKQPRHQESICLFVVFAVLNQPQLFVKNKFVLKIASACEKMARINDYAIMFYLSAAFDAMNKADKNIFFNEFITVRSSDFATMYFMKYACYYETLESLLLPRLLQLRTIDGKWKEFIEFERLLKLLNQFVRLYVKDTMSPDQISRFIFAFLLSISTTNIIRNRSISIDLYLPILESTLIDFKNLTGIDLININSHLSLKNDTEFYELVSNFAQSFQFLNFNVLQTLISSIETLIPTKHNECGLICLSSYLASVTNTSSSDSKRLKNKAVELFTSFLKKYKFESSLIQFVVARLPSCFTVATLKEMDQSYLSIFLKLTFDIASKSADFTPSLHLILNIIRSSTPSFISPFIQPIIDALRESVSSGKTSLSSILVLNVIGELGRRKMDPTVLLKDGSVSFRSLSPLLLSNDNEIKTRVNAIFSLMIFGKSEMDPDFELVFTSLMSLFVGYEKGTAHYVAIATDLLKIVEKLPKVGRKELDLLKFAFQPVLSVGDSNCSVAICELLKYLKKLTLDIKSDDDDLFSFVLGMMTIFAKPKRNFPISNT